MMFLNKSHKITFGGNLYWSFSVFLVSIEVTHINFHISVLDSFYKCPKVTPALTIMHNDSKKKRGKMHIIVDKEHLCVGYKEKCLNNKVIELFLRSKADVI